MTNITETEQNSLDLLRSIEGITVLGLEKLENRGVYAGFHEPCISWIDDRKHTHDEIEDWVVRTLKRERIRGEFFLSASLFSVCRVRLESPWFWARTMWRLAPALWLISIEQDYSLSLFWTEHCNRRGRDRIGYGAFRWIKPPATAPAFWG